MHACCHCHHHIKGPCIASTPLAKTGQLNVSLQPTLQETPSTHSSTAPAASLPAGLPCWACRKSKLEWTLHSLCPTSLSIAQTPSPTKTTHADTQHGQRQFLCLHNTTFHISTPAHHRAPHSSGPSECNLGHKITKYVNRSQQHNNPAHCPDMAPPKSTPHPLCYI